MGSNGYARVEPVESDLTLTWITLLVAIGAYFFPKARACTCASGGGSESGSGVDPREPGNGATPPGVLTTNYFTLSRGEAANVFAMYPDASEFNVSQEVSDALNAIAVNKDALVANFRSDTWITAFANGFASEGLNVLEITGEQGV